MSKHYSIESLKEIAGDDTEFMVVVAQTFLDEIPPDLHSLEEAVANNNKQLTYQFAHKMKPNFEMFGVELAKDISFIESWTRTSKKNDAIAGYMENVSTTLTHVFKELKEDFNL